MRKLLLAAALLLGTTAAYAQILPDAYVGAAVSRARLDDIFGSGRDFNLHNTAWKAFAGIRPIPFFGVEAGYMDLGSESRNFGFGGVGERVHVDAHAFSAFAVGSLRLPVPIVNLSVFGKAGAARWTLDGHTNPSLFALDDHGTNFAWGAGAQARFGPLGVRLEYEQFSVRNTDGAKVVSLGASYHFL